MKSAWLQSRRVQWMKGLKEVQIHKQSSSGQRCPRLGRKRTFKVFLFDFNTRNSCQIKVCLICCRKKRLMFTTCAPFTPFASPLRGSICNKKKGAERVHASRTKKGRLQSEHVPRQHTLLRN